jgi:hypothetical protein
MKKSQYTPEESLERIKLMMGYDVSKTLNENREIIFEQDNEQDTINQKIANDIYKSMVRPGTDEELLVASIESIKDKNQFNLVNDLVTQLYKTKFKKETGLGISELINGDLDSGDTEYVKQITDHLNGIGVNATYETTSYRGKEYFKIKTFKIDDKSTSGGENTSTQKPTPATYEEVQSGKGILKMGMRGPAVNQLQQMLVELGYDLGKGGNNQNGVDGGFGKLTDAAVRQFQTSNPPLTVDGIVGKNTSVKILEKWNEVKSQKTSDVSNDENQSQGLRIDPKSLGSGSKISNTFN